MNARYQDGDIGKFLSQDPAFQVVGSPELKAKTNLELDQYLSDPQLHNSYSYVKNNPLKHTDPSGEMAQLLIPLILYSPQIINYTLSLFTPIAQVGISQAVDDTNSGNYAWAIFGAFTAGEGSTASKGTAKVAGEVAEETEKVIIKAGDTIAGLKVTVHAEEGFATRNVTKNQVSDAINNGVKYLDIKTGNLLHVVGERGKGGYTIVTDYAQKTLVSVENFVRKLSTNNSLNRFKKLDKIK